MGDTSPTRLAAALLTAIALTRAASAADVQQQQSPVAVVAYLDGRGDLAPETRRRTESLGRLTCPLPVALCVVDEGLVSRWLLRQPSTPPVTLGPQTISAPSQQALLAQYLREVVVHCSPGPLCVWLRGHGLPPLAGKGERGTYRLLTGADEGLTAGELRTCLQSVLGGRRCRPLVLETCFAASLEACWELEPVATQLVALYGQATQPGLQWQRLLAMADRNAADWQPAGACVYDLSRMPQVRDAFAAWCRALVHEGDVAAFARAAQWTRQQHSSVPLWQSCDLGELVGAMEAASDKATVRDACEQLLGALRRFVQWPRPRGSEEAEPLGVTLFVPPLPSAEVESYVRCTALATESGYGDLLRSYVQYGEGLLPVAGG